MTDRLRDLMHDKASEATFPIPDVDTLVASARGRFRRQGLVAGGVAVVLVAAAAVGVGSLRGGDGDPSLVTDVPGREAGVFERGPLTWASGSVIHFGAEDLEVGRRVQAFVQTSAGFVVASDGEVFAVDDDGTSKVGEIDARDPQLVADEDGPYAAWVQRGASSPTVAVVDVRNLTTSAEPARGPAFEGRRSFSDLYALDDDQVYWRDARGVVAVDVATGRADVLEADPGGTFDLVDVESGVLAFQTDEASGLRIGPSLAEAPVVVDPSPSSGRLSPGAARYAPDAEVLQVLDVDGTNVSPALPGYYFSSAFAWLDDDTVAVVALSEESRGESELRYSLLTCSVAAGECELAEPDVGAEGDFAPPVGSDITVR